MKTPKEQAAEVAVQFAKGLLGRVVEGASHGIIDALEDATDQLQNAVGAQADEIRSRTRRARARLRRSRA